jgi:hypothetical protein
LFKVDTEQLEAVRKAYKELTGESLDIAMYNKGKTDLISTAERNAEQI